MVDDAAFKVLIFKKMNTICNIKLGLLQVLHLH